MNTVRKSNRLTPAFNSVFGDFLNDDFMNWPVNRTEKNWNRVPAVNISENDDEWVVELAAPGMEKSDFQIELDQEVLSVSAQKEEKNEEKNDKYSVREFSYSNFSRSFRLPEHIVDGQKINAKYDNGVLKLHIPKKEEAKPQPVRTIDIS
jgi:HSP20 family protein